MRRFEQLVRLRFPGRLGDGLEATVRGVVRPESIWFSLQVIGVPEQHLVKVFAANSSDQPFNEGIWERQIRNGFDLLYIQDAKIRLPAVLQE